ncbi:MAG: hypothetical protein KF744_15120 [Taibaiella sp.]|nr:hypothetical protein [Taibaiella sp.]
MVDEALQMRALSRYRLLSSTLLLFNGVGALYGGFSLMSHPDGSGLRLSMQLLQHTPFANYLIPGLVLFVINGLFSITALMLLATRYRGYERYVILQGLLLAVWLLVQIALIRTLDMMHVIMGITALGLLICGAMIARLNKSLELN